MLYCFRLPGEAQKINRIMDAFGSHYFATCKNGVFVNTGLSAIHLVLALIIEKMTDAAQIMAFSAIMLTTDAHNPRVLEKMTKQQFVTMTRGMNGEGNFPKVLTPTRNP
jgi:Sec7-like guanine-nucleotide exchange factor